MNHNKLGRDVALRLLAVPDDERVVHAVVVTPPPPLLPLKELQLVFVRPLVRRGRQHKLGRLARGRRRARLAELFGRAAVEHAEASDERAFARRPIRAQAGVLGVREKRDGADVVRGGPAGRLAVGGFVAGAGLKLGDAAQRGVSALCARLEKEE